MSLREYNIEVIFVSVIILFIAVWQVSGLIQSHSISRNNEIYMIREGLENAASAASAAAINTTTNNEITLNKAMSILKSSGDPFLNGLGLGHINSPLSTEGFTPTTSENEMTIHQRRQAGTVMDGGSVAVPIPAPTAPAPVPAPVPVAAAPADASRRSRLGDAFGRMLSNYLTAENNRNARENMYRVRNDDETGTGAGTATANTNLFSMLYTYAQPIVFGATATGAATAATAAERGPPSASTINRATLNTRYASIVSPVNTTCPISRDEFEDNSEITMIRGCNHIFNRASLREWFVNHSTCPMCRNDIHNYREEPGIGASASSDVSNIYSRIMDNSRNFTNMEINNISNDSVTFSYDLPPMYDRYNDEEIYRDILTAVAGTAGTEATTRTTPPQAPAVTRDYRYDDDDDDNGHHDYDSHDYMEVD